MNGMQKPNRIYVAVTPSGAARCKWCGSAESIKWRSTKDGIYCSGECEEAAGALSLLCGFVLWQTITVFLVMLILMPTVERSGSPGLGVLILEGVSLWFLYSSWQGWQQRRAVPKNSKRDDTTLDLALLRTAATRVKCLVCNATLDLGKTGRDMVYRCDYCGTTGYVELIKARD